MGNYKSHRLSHRHRRGLAGLRTIMKGNQSAESIRDAGAAGFMDLDGEMTTEGEEALGKRATTEEDD